MAVIPIRFIDLHDDGFHPLIDIKVYGKPFVVVLDTGASKTAFDRHTLLQLKQDTVFIKSDRLSTGLGTNTMESSLVLIENLRIGKFLLRPVEVAALDLSTINIAYRQLGHSEVLGVLGSDILMKYNAVIDYEKSILKLKKKGPKHNTSGLSLRYLSLHT